VQISLQFGNGPITPVAYQDTEHYVVTRAFLERPERMLREMMEPEPNPEQ
jgi:predicted ATPase